MQLKMDVFDRVEQSIRRYSGVEDLNDDALNVNGHGIVHTLE